MEMSPERLDMLVAEFEDTRTDLKELRTDVSHIREKSGNFQGKVEGSVRVLHFFIMLGTTVLTAVAALMWNNIQAVNELKAKMGDFSPVKIEIMANEVADLKQRVSTLEQRPTESRKK